MLLPEHDYLILNADGSAHPNPHKLCLAAWRLLRDLSAGEMFQEKLQPPFEQLTDERRAICTMPSGGPFVTGVLVVLVF